MAYIRLSVAVGQLVTNIIQSPSSMVTLRIGVVISLCFLSVAANGYDKELSSRPVTALILARGGSKGIPLKNLVQINGESLLTRSLRVLLRFGRFNRIWMSTEDNRIAAAVETDFLSEQVAIHRRPMAVAEDWTTSIESTQEFLAKHPDVERLALVQCTSPFLKVRYLEEAFRLFQTLGDRVDCVFAVTRSYKLRWKMTDGWVAPLNFDPDRRPRRQDWDGELLETGMFYFAHRKLLEGGRFQNDNCRVVEIDQKDSLEIDTLEDLELARFMAARNESTEEAKS